MESLKGLSCCVISIKYCNTFLVIFVPCLTPFLSFLVLKKAYQITAKQERKNYAQQNFCFSFIFWLIVKNERNWSLCKMKKPKLKHKITINKPWSIFFWYFVNNNSFVPTYSLVRLTQTFNCYWISFRF